MVSECKIRQLQTENEALRNHLKLALDSIRNPIPPVVVHKRRSGLYSVNENDGSPSNRKRLSRARSPPSDVEPEPEPDLIWEDEDTMQSEASHVEAQEMQTHMENLLDDLSMFKRKIATDHERFRPSWKPEGRKRRRALGNVWVNNR